MTNTSHIIHPIKEFYYDWIVKTATLFYPCHAIKKIPNDGYLSNRIIYDTLQKCYRR